jgi:hypothetical protein
VDNPWIVCFPSRDHRSFADHPPYHPPASRPRQRRSRRGCSRLAEATTCRAAREARRV